MTVAIFYKRQFKNGKGYHQVKVYGTYTYMTGLDNLLHTVEHNTQIGIIRQLQDYNGPDGQMLTKSQLKTLKDIMKLHLDGVVTYLGYYSKD